MKYSVFLITQFDWRIDRYSTKILHKTIVQVWFDHHHTYLLIAQFSFTRILIEQYQFSRWQKHAFG